MDESRIFWRNKGPDSADEDQNPKTVFLSSSQALEPAPPLAIRELFHKHYVRIREWLSEDDRPGVALVAMDGDAVRGAAFLATKPDVVSTAILGRHTQADLCLGGDASLSLRHLALLLYPRHPSGHGARYRLLDLRTSTGFIDERGRRLRALEADGPAFVRCGRYAVLIFPCEGEGQTFTEDAETAWNSIPERLYLDEVPAEEKSREWEKESDRAWDVDALPDLSEPPTLVHRLAGPQSPVHELIVEGEPPLGEVRIISPRGLATVVVGASAARAGILLGRSRRCDAGRVLADRTISRVHLLIIQIAGRLYAVDTASYNGVYHKKEKERATPLADGRPLSLSGLATVEWQSKQDSH